MYVKIMTNTCSKILVCRSRNSSSHVCLTLMPKTFDNENNIAVLLYFLVIQQLIEDKAVGVSPEDTSIVPDAFGDEELQDYEEHMHNFFTIFDANENDRLNLEEFKSLLHHLNLHALNDTEIMEIYRDMNNGTDGELTFENMFQYLRSIIIMEADLSPAKFCLFQAMLSADHLNQCALGGITQFLNQSWAKFSQYRRYGQNGQLVMSSGDNIAVHNEGTYSLLDLICWSDRLADTIQPAHAVIKGVSNSLDNSASRWRESVTNKI